MKYTHLSIVFSLITALSAALFAPLPSSAFLFRSGRAAQQHAELGEYLATIGDYERAIMHYEDAREKKPRDKTILFTLGALHQKLGDYDSALEVYGHMHELYTRDPHVSICIGNVYLSKEDFLTAIIWFRHATDLDKTLAVAHRNLGFAQLLAGATHGAIVSLERAHELAPDDALTTIDLALAYYQADRADDAKKHINAALRKRSSPAFRAMYADVLAATTADDMEAAIAAYNNNQFERAQEILMRVVETYPDHALAWTYLGHSFHHRRPSDPVRAEIAYREAVDAHQRARLDRITLAALLDNIGMIRFNLGDAEEAEAFFAQAAGLDTDYPVAYFNYGLVLAQRNAYPLAATAFADAIRRNTNFLAYVSHHAALDGFRATQAYTNLLSTFSFSPSTSHD